MLEAFLKNVYKSGMKAVALLRYDLRIPMNFLGCVFISLLMWSLMNAEVIKQQDKTDPKKKMTECRLSQLGGKQPMVICEMREFLIAYKTRLATKKITEKTTSLPGTNNGIKEVNDTFQRLTIWDRISNNLLLCGSVGTGKTTAAKLFAQDAGIDPEVHRAIDIAAMPREVGKLFIQQLYKQANERAENAKEPVVIVFDDIDDLYDPVKKTGNEGAVLSELNFQLQENLGNPNVITVLTANRRDLIEQKLKSRCYVVKWPAPDWSNRYEIIKFYCNKYPHALSDGDLRSLVWRTVGFAGRDIEAAFDFAYRKAQFHGKFELTSNLVKEAFSEQREVIDATISRSLLSRYLYWDRVQACFGY